MIVIKMHIRKKHKDKPYSRKLRLGNYLSISSILNVIILLCKLDTLGPTKSVQIMKMS